ncbi:MAG: NHL repeat-containing protein, partial [Deltaproteobacteria bacterium]|nr:NHL repeat-containing protein [Deltaproteobacteria bacterium]
MEYVKNYLNNLMKKLLQFSLFLLLSFIFLIDSGNINNSANAATESNFKVGTTPYGLAVGKKDNVYAAISGFNNVIELNQNGKLIKNINTDWAPSGIVISKTGYVYVSTGIGNVVKLNNKGQILKKVKVGIIPAGIAVGPDGNIYVTSIHSKTVTKLSPSLTVLKIFYAGIAPYGIVLNDNGLIYVTNFTNKGTVTVLNKSGKIIKVFDAQRKPEGIAIGPAGNIYVTNGLSDSVLKFNKNGKILEKINIKGAPYG